MKLTQVSVNYMTKGVIMISEVKNKALTVLAGVKFHTNQPSKFQGKVDIGAMVTCMLLSILKWIGLCNEDLMLSNAGLRGVTGSGMKKHGMMKAKVTCIDITKEVKVILTELGTKLILGLEFCKHFSLASITDACVQRKISYEQCEQVEAVYITEESEVDYTALEKK